MPPYCEEHARYHESPFECGDMLRAETARKRQARKVAAAEKIAARVIVAEQRRDGEAFPRNWDDVQRIAAAAALIALNGAEERQAHG